jgi:hypothetical protein
MFCTRPLGENEVLESFPVGRRLAFDAARGRLWVVCRSCDRWNLSPLEERWEAVEDCERLFRETRLRVSTDNVGLARHREGLELVRIGAPMRPEFAAWRYGDQFGRRRKRAMLYTGVGVAGFAALNLGGAFLLSGGMGGYWAWQAWETIRRGRTLVKLEPGDGPDIKLNADDLKQVRIRPANDGQGFRLAVRKKKREWWFEGPRAEVFASQIVPRMNRRGGKQEVVRTAVDQIERHGHPNEFLAQLVTGDQFQSKKGVPGYLNKMPTPTRLALEMALHEEEERRALEGELWRLERAWEKAEEIAAISDDLFLPEGTEAFLDRHRDD